MKACKTVTTLLKAEQMDNLFKAGETVKILLKAGQNHLKA